MRFDTLQAFETPQRTLVLHTGALGDFLLACPALRSLALRGPIELVGHPERHALAVAAGLAKRAHPLDVLGLHEVFAAPEAAVKAPPARLRAFLRPFNRAQIWMRDPDDLLAHVFRRAGVAVVGCAPGLPHGDWPGHACDYYLNTVGARESVPTAAFRLELGPSDTPLPQLDIVLQPGSGSPRKNWPLAHFHALSQALLSRGRRVTWLVGPAEADCAPPPGAALLQESDLVALGRALASAELFIGNDTGTTHLAAQVGCPTVALFGPTDPAQWGPIGARVCVVVGTPWPTVEAILGAANVNLLTEHPFQDRI